MSSALQYAPDAEGRLPRVAAARNRMLRMSLLSQRDDDFTESSFEAVRGGVGDTHSVKKLPPKFETPLPEAAKVSLDDAQLRDEVVEIGRIFVSQTEWEGQIEAINGQIVSAVARDIAAPFEAEKLFDIPLDSIPASEREFVSLGAVFRLCVGDELRFTKSKRNQGKWASQSKNDVRIYFRRHFFKNPKEVASMQASIQKLAIPSGV